RRAPRAAVEWVDAVDDDEARWRHLWNGLEFLLPCVPDSRRVRAKAALPDDEQRPQDEQTGEHEARQHASEEQAPDRGLGRDPVENESDRRRNQDAERAAGAD